VNRQVNAIAGRLSLRQPQRRSLEILDRIVEIAPPRKGMGADEALAVIRSEFPSVTDFEKRDFPSLCFALATGVGKTRLMGAFITYLHLAHGINNFFVLAPNLTIYNKLIADFTPNTPKYVFKGISEFATAAPGIITGDNYESMAGTLFDETLRCRINIFNISKINSEVRGGRSPRVKRLSEYIGESYFAFLSRLPDLVLLMDESHRYRASAGVRAINELKPILGLELMATPFVESATGPTHFKNVAFDYPLSRTMADGFVKEPAVVTRKDFNPAGMTPEQIQQMKLEDGIRLHEGVKVELETYARETGSSFVKPFLLAIARDTTHAKELLELVQSDSFSGGRYRGRALQVDSSQTGAEEEKMIASLLEVEKPDSPVEIVIHVNMLKEGWDVTNLYTIVPLRAANARTLVEQSIGRGLRLPYGRRTGVASVDRLNIVAHDRFQEIVDDANRPDSPLRIQTLILDSESPAPKVTVVSQSVLSTRLGIVPDHSGPTTIVAGASVAPAFPNAAEMQVAQIARDVIREYESRPQEVPSASYLNRPEVRAQIAEKVSERYQPAQMGIEGIAERPDIAAVVARTTELVSEQTIDIPRILVLPKSNLKSRFSPFRLDLSRMRYAAVSEDLWVQYLRTGEREILSLATAEMEERRPEDYVVRNLMDFDDVSYDENADLLYDLAAQTVAHLNSYLQPEDTVRVLQYHQREIARFIHAQMVKHFHEDDTEYEVKVSRGFCDLRPSAFASDSAEPLDFRFSPPDKKNISSYIFGGFEHCLFPVQKFQSDTERKIAVILEREKVKWFKPARGQFQIYYKSGGDHLEYQPDFVVEDAAAIYMLEPKEARQMDDPTVQAKRQAAEEWCRHASNFSATYKGKPWSYILIPHDAVSDNMTIGGLTTRYAV
jgi:type III restriction enzyme